MSERSNTFPHLFVVGASAGGIEAPPTFVVGDGGPPRLYEARGRPIGSDHGGGAVVFRETASGG